MRELYSELLLSSGIQRSISICGPRRSPHFKQPFRKNSAVLLCAALRVLCSPFLCRLRQRTRPQRPSASRGTRAGSGLASPCRRQPTRNAARCLPTPIATSCALAFSPSAVPAAGSKSRLPRVAGGACMSHSTMAAAVPASRSRIQVPLEEAAHLGVAPLPPAPASSLATAATATASAAAAASSSAAAAAHEDTEAEAQAVFAECCQALNLDSDTRSEAWDMWARARTYLCSDDLGDLRPWFCCTIYLASHHAFQSSRSGRGAHVAFSGLISCCKLT